MLYPHCSGGVAKRFTFPNFKGSLCIIAALINSKLVATLVRGAISSSRSQYMEEDLANLKGLSSVSSVVLVF